MMINMMTDKGHHKDDYEEDPSSLVIFYFLFAVFLSILILCLPLFLILLLFSVESSSRSYSLVILLLCLSSKFLPKYAQGHLGKLLRTNFQALSICRIGRRCHPGIDSKCFPLETGQWIKLCPVLNLR